VLKTISLGLLALILFLFGAAAAINRLAPISTSKFLRDQLRNAAGLEVKALETQGKTFPYLMGGTGEPLVLVHGFTANKDTWNAIARYLTPHLTVYALDLPGFGDAARDPNGEYSLDAQVENLHAFVKGLGLTSAHFGGSSMGGGVVAFYAAKYPNEVSSVWLLDAAATQDAIESQLKKNYISTGEYPLLVKTPEQQARQFQLLFGKVPFIPYSVAYALLENSRKDFDFHSAILKILVNGNTPIEARYSNLQTPALIVTGEQDQIIPPTSVKALAKVFPKSETKIMSGLGHIPMTEDPKTTAGDYLAFRATLTRAH
jgi:triacylglycerol lipase